jgi:ferredoxin
MPHYVAEPCIKCRYTECVTVCPVDCFYEGANMLVIRPEDCIDCGACIPMCPVSAIYPEDDLPAKWESYKELNEKFSHLWPRLSQRRGPLFDAEKFEKVTGKAVMLDERPGEGDPPAPPEDDD